MKKIKLILPIICSGTTLLTAATALTSCKDSDYKTKVLKLTNGDTHLISGVENDKAIAGQSYHPWKAVDADGKEVKDVKYDLIPVAGSEINTIHIGTTDGFIYWNANTEKGIYKFKVSASYEKEGLITRATSDVITLEVTDQTKVRIPEGKDATCNFVSSNNGTYFEIKGFELVNGLGLVIEPDLLYDSDFSIDVEEMCEEKELGDVVLTGLREETDWIFDSDAYRRFSVYGYFKNDDLALGSHELKITITNNTKGNPVVYNQKFIVNSSFSTDTWENVGQQAAKGLDHLKKYYGVDTFVGLSRTVLINGLKHKVTVVGENEDIDENGKLVPLTFQFMNVISEKYVDDRGNLKIAPLSTHWNIKSTTSTNYWESNISKALNDDSEIFTDWYRGYADEKQPASTSSCVYKLLPESLKPALKSVKRKALCYDSTDKKYENIEQSAKLFLPSLNSFFSDEGISISKDDNYFVTDEKRQNFMDEDDQYTFYKNVIGNESVVNTTQWPTPISAWNEIDLSFVTSLNPDYPYSAWPIALTTANQKSTSGIFCWSKDILSNFINPVSGAQWTFLTPMFGI